MRSPRSRRSAGPPEEPDLSPAVAAIIDRVACLSDGDLRSELTEHAFSCGPIVGTTRSVYQKKLVDLILAQDLPQEARTRRAPSTDEESEEDEPAANGHDPVNGDASVNEIEESIDAREVDESQSDTVEEEEEEEEAVVAADDAADASQEESQEDSQDEAAVDVPADVSDINADVLRQRVAPSVETKTVSYVSEDGKTVKRTTTTTTRVVRRSDIGSFGDSHPSQTPASAPASATTQPEKKKSTCMSLIIQLIVIAVIVGFVYIIIMGPSSQLAIPSKEADIENPQPSDSQV
jgi:hypothetical protein